MTKGLKNDRAKATIIPPVITLAPCPWGRALVLQPKDDPINQKSQGYFKHSVENWIPVHLLRCNPTEAKYLRLSRE
jgi:hypothetical protein